MTTEQGPTHHGSSPGYLRLLLAALAAVTLLTAGCASSDTSTDAAGEATGEATDSSESDGGESDGQSGDNGTGDGGDASGDAATDAADADNADAEDTTATTTMTDDALAEAAEVTVLDPGSEPRIELRLQIEPGQSETMVITQVQEIKQVIGGQAGPDLGAIGMVIEQDMMSSTAGGDLLTITSLIKSATVEEETNPLVATQLQTALDGLVGATSQSTVDTRGRVLATELGGLDTLDPTTSATMEELLSSSQFAHPLPGEPVGVGATWQIVQMLPAGGLEVEQITTYEILAIDGSVVELALSTEQLVDEGQKLEAGGSSATVLQWEGISSGSITYDLTSMVPASTAQLIANQELEFGPGAEKTVLEQSIQTSVVVTAG